MYERVGLFLGLRSVGSEAPFALSRPYVRFIYVPHTTTHTTHAHTVLISVLPCGKPIVHTCCRLFQNPELGACVEFCSLFSNIIREGLDP